MPLELTLRCRCGHVCGVASEISPASGFRFVCYCKDCQAFARFIERPDVLDAAGGTDIFQMPPARVSLTAGADALRCLRLSADGGPALVRRLLSHALANTAATPRFPVVGLIHSFMSQVAAGRSRDEILGPPLCRIYERSAVASLPSSAPAPPSFGTFVHRASKLLGWWVRGLARPSPFFDDRTNAPRAEPRALTPGERAAL